MCGRTGLDDACTFLRHHIIGYLFVLQKLGVTLVQDQPKPIIMQTGFGPAAEILDDHEMGGVQVTAQSRAALMAKLARYLCMCVLCRNCPCVLCSTVIIFSWQLNKALALQSAA